jgi:hypothetical protein
MNDQFDVSLEDDDLLDEVELTASLMVAANQAERHLTQAEIDEVLGVSPGFPRQRTGTERPDPVRDS